MGAFVDEAETLSITMTDKPERDDTKLEELTSFTINPIFGEMKTLELYETGVDTNIFRSRRLEIVITLDQYPTDAMADTMEITLTSNLAPGIVVTETLTETEFDSKIFTGPDNISLTFDHFSDRDADAQDDIRAIVTCPALNLENAFIDARETDLSSLEFRTDVLHNQGESGSGLLYIGETQRRILSTFDYDGPEIIVDAEIFLQDVDSEIKYQLEESESRPKFVINASSGKQKEEYLKNFVKSSDIFISVTQYEEPSEPSATVKRIEYSNDEKSKILIRAKSGDKLILEFELDNRKVSTELVVINIKIEEIIGKRKNTPGDFTQERDPTHPGRLFIDTTEMWTGGMLDARQYDSQRVLIKVKVEPDDIDISDFLIKWEYYDPDDPADHPDIDSNGNIGADNTGMSHEGADFWFVEANSDHSIVDRKNEVPVDENTIIEEVKTKLAKKNDSLKSSVFFYFSDDGGDNYKIKVYLTKDDKLYGKAESGILTAWRKRYIRVYAMEKENDDVQLHDVGTQLEMFAKCIDVGENGRIDTMLKGGDDRITENGVYAGYNGEVESEANSGGDNFDPKISQLLFVDGYANSDPNICTYIDFVIEKKSFECKYQNETELTSHNFNIYMHSYANYGAHVAATYSIIGVFDISGFTTDVYGFAWTVTPHAAILAKPSYLTGQEDVTSIINQIHHTDIHEIGHLLVDKLETVPDFHQLHTEGCNCAFGIGESNVTNHICPRHISIIRDSISRTFPSGCPGNEGDVKYDSNQSRK